MPPKEALSPRILGLVSAEQILSREGIITSTVRARIRNRIAELLNANGEEAAGIVLRYLSKFNIEAKEAAERKKPEVPSELMSDLSRQELTLLRTLLEDVGNVVETRDLVEAIYYKEMDLTVRGTDNKEAHTLRRLVCVVRKKIKGWGEIFNKSGIGYRLEITAK